MIRYQKSAVRSGPPVLRPPRKPVTRPTMASPCGGKFSSTSRHHLTTHTHLTPPSGFTDYPNCLTHVYQDAVATGYTLLGCGVAAGSDKIYVTANTETSSSSTQTRNPTGTRTGTGTSNPTTTSTPINPLGPNATNPPVPQSSTTSSTPIGPIVGGGEGVTFCCCALYTGAGLCAGGGGLDGGLILF